MVVGAGEFTVIVEVGGNAFVPNDCGSGTDQQTVSANVRAE